MREVYVKRALVPTRLGAAEYAVNPYAGCGHCCAYCYAPYVTRDPDFCAVRVRRNLPSVLDRELRRARMGRILVGTVTDAYQEAEDRCRVTRLALEVIAKRGFPATILTKSALFVRDADLIARIPGAEVGVTVTSLEGWEEYEGGSDPAERIEALKSLPGGVIRYLFLGPILKGRTERDLREIMDLAADAGISYVLVDMLRLKEGMREKLMATALKDAVDAPLSYYRDVAMRAARMGRERGMRVEALF